MRVRKRAAPLLGADSASPSASPGSGRRSPGSSPLAPQGTRGTAMNTNDAKEYLARREIPQLFEVGARAGRRAGASGDCISGVRGEAAARRPTFPTRGM